MIQKRVDHYRIRIIEYGIEVEKVKVLWLKEMISELDEKLGLGENASNK
jgi:hypothetical protein